MVVVMMIVVVMVMPPPRLPGGKYLVPVVVVGVWIVEAHFYMLSSGNIVEMMILMRRTRQL